MGTLGGRLTEAHGSVGGPCSIRAAGELCIALNRTIADVAVDINRGTLDPPAHLSRGGGRELPSTIVKVGADGNVCVCVCGGGGT